VPKKIDTELSIFYINFIFIQARLEKLSPFEMGKFISRHFSCNSICCQQSDLPHIHVSMFRGDFQISRILSRGFVGVATHQNDM